MYDIKERKGQISGPCMNYTENGKTDEMGVQVLQFKQQHHFLLIVSYGILLFGSVVSGDLPRDAFPVLIYDSSFDRKKPAFLQNSCARVSRKFLIKRKLCINWQPSSLRCAALSVVIEP